MADRIGEAFGKMIAAPFLAVADGIDAVEAASEATVKLQTVTPAPPFYAFRALAADDSIDERCQLGSAFAQLASQLRAHPALLARSDAAGVLWGLVAREAAARGLGRAGPKEHATLALGLGRGRSHPQCTASSP